MPHSGLETEGEKNRFWAGKLVELYGWTFGHYTDPGPFDITLCGRWYNSEKVTVVKPGSKNVVDVCVECGNKKRTGSEGNGFGRPSGFGTGTTWV